MCEKTFEWGTFKVFGKIPKQDALVVVAVTIATVFTNLATAVILGILITALVFAWEHAKQLSVRTHMEKQSKIYELTGTLFFASVANFQELFDVRSDPGEVIVEFLHARVADHSAIEAIERLGQKYQPAGKRLRLRHETYPEVDRVHAGLKVKDLKMGPHTFIVVSTQGECDEEALENALQTDATYVAFVASKAKAAKVLEYLGARGVSAERLKQVRAPAGMDIGASSPEEIAVSILAQIVQLSRSRSTTSEKAPIAAEQQEAKDPVCGMTVTVGAAKHKSDYDGKTIYFCCAGCKQKFDKQPDLFAPTGIPA